MAVCYRGGAIGQALVNSPLGACTGYKCCNGSQHERRRAAEPPRRQGTADSSA